MAAIQGQDGGRLHALGAVVAELASPGSAERMAEVIGDAAVNALGAEFVVVGLTDDHGHVRPMHVNGVAPGAVDRVLMALGPELVEQPIAVGARSLGRIVLGTGSDRPFSEADRGFVRVLAGLFALALDRPRALSLGDLAIDLERHEVAIDGRAVRLTPSELRLLLLLAEQPGRPRSRREILRHLSGADSAGHERACDVHIANLRRKLEREPSKPKRLLTLRGVGYALIG